MSKETEHLVSEAYLVATGMEYRGGGFIKALSLCVRRADLNNLRKIKNNWPNEWKEYREVGEMLRARGEMNDQ